MIGKILNIVPYGEDQITVFYSISNDIKVIEENEHFSNDTSYKDIINYVDTRRVAIENIPEPNYEPLIGEIIEEVIIEEVV